MKVEKTNIIYSLVLSLFILSQPYLLAQATSEGLRFTPSMNIENVLDIASSPSHLYVLSEQEGLAVFRVTNDNTQWLYTNRTT